MPKSMARPKTGTPRQTCSRETGDTQRPTLSCHPLFRTNACSGTDRQLASLSRHCTPTRARHTSYVYQNMWRGMCIDMPIGMCIDIDVCMCMRMDMRVDICIDMCIDMCMDIRHVYNRHVYRHSYRHKFSGGGNKSRKGNKSRNAQDCGSRCSSYLATCVLQQGLVLLQNLCR